MNNVLFKTKSLIREIKSSHEYNRYHCLKNKLASNEELYAKVNEFRKKGFEIQTTDSVDNTFAQAEALRLEYDDILSLPLVEDYLAAEQKICALMQNIYETMAEVLEFDMGFLEK